MPKFRKFAETLINTVIFAVSLALILTGAILVVISYVSEIVNIDGASALMIIVIGVIVMGLGARFPIRM